MVHNKILSKVTVSDLKEYAVAHDYDWKLEILPNLDAITEHVELNTDKSTICSLAIHKAIGTPLKRQAEARKKVYDIHQP